METIILIRTSTEEQNPENQLKDCKTLAKFGEYEVVKEQQSAFKDNDRPKLDYITKQIKLRKVKHLIVWDLDRLFRNQKKLVSFFELCNGYKCKFHSYRQQWLEEINMIPEPWGEIVHSLMLNIMGWLAEEESKKKSDRVKIAHKNSKKKWGRKPINKRVTNKIIELHNQGKTLREIAAEVCYWDQSNNKHQVSKSAVHKIIQDYKDKK